MSKSALIVGAGPGISGEFAKRLAGDGYRVALAARSGDRAKDIAEEIGARVHAVEASEPASVAALFDAVDGDQGAPEVVLYNPSARVRGSILDLDPDDVRRAIDVSAFGGFLVAQQAARRMVEAGGGAILFTGASASVKGYPMSASFAMGKFALRGLAQSLARELHPKNIHVCHFLIDGGVRSDTRSDRREPQDDPDSMLDPGAIADSYMAALNQHRSAWSHEIDLRPWVERF